MNNVEVAWPLVSRRRYGVPIGGAFDEPSFRMTLALLGLESGSGLEIGFMGGEWISETETTLASFGCARTISVNGVEESNHRFVVPAGGHLALGPALSHHRSYLVLDGAAKPTARLFPLTSTDGQFRVIPTDFANEAFFEKSHRVTPQINRIGLRLETTSALAHTLELPSEPQCVGSIQITPDGTPIIIGPDGPTLGGYPKIGSIISADIHRLAQIKPGDMLRFERSILDDAWLAMEEQKSQTAARCREIRLAARLSMS